MVKYWSNYLLVRVLYWSNAGRPARLWRGCAGMSNGDEKWSSMTCQNVKKWSNAVKLSMICENVKEWSNAVKCGQICGQMWSNLSLPRAEEWKRKTEN